MLKIDNTTLAAVAPHISSAVRTASQRVIVQGFGAVLADTLEKYRIDTPVRIWNFIGQIAHETDGFTTLVEYASGDAYESRKDLGNFQPGDGRRYKGRGGIMTTGRANYQKAGIALNLDLVGSPELLALPTNALLSSCYFWSAHNLNVPADRDDLVALTKAINGGTNGLEQRRGYTLAAKAAVTSITAAVAPVHETRTTLYLGCVGDDVSHLQTLLKLRKFPDLSVNGTFDTATDLAVRAFQRTYGLVIDGIVGANTWNVL